MAKKALKRRSWTEEEVRMLKTLAREKTKTSVIARTDKAEVSQQLGSNSADWCVRENEFRRAGEEWLREIQDTTVSTYSSPISEGANKSWCSPTGARPVRVRP
jgi:hypothetical protein